jgi:hypothetical protein
LASQRFKQFNGSASKIDTKVSFPLKLEMFPYTNRARGQDKQQNFELARGCTYDLQSVVVHVGNLESGESSSSLACRRHTDDTTSPTPVLGTSGSSSTTTRSLLHRSRRFLTNRLSFYFMSSNHWHELEFTNFMLNFHALRHSVHIEANCTSCIGTASSDGTCLLA